MSADRYHLRLPVEALIYDGVYDGPAHREIAARLAATFPGDERGGLGVSLGPPRAPIVFTAPDAHLEDGHTLHAGDVVIITYREGPSGHVEAADVRVLAGPMFREVYRPAKEW